MNLLQAQIDKEKIINFYQQQKINKSVFLIQIYVYVYLIFIGIDGSLGIISQAYNKNSINLKNEFNYLENKNFIKELLPNFQKSYYWNYYFYKYKISGSIKKNKFKFNKDVLIYEYF